MIDIKVRKTKEKKSVYILGYFLGSYHKTGNFKKNYSNSAKFGPPYFSGQILVKIHPLKQTWAAVKWPYTLYFG
jgi:hypothetical protein